MRKLLIIGVVAVVLMMIHNLIRFDFEKNLIILFGFMCVPLVFVVGVINSMKK